MYKKRLVLMALATATSMNSFANVGELPGPGEMPASISASMNSKQRMEYRQKRMDAYQRLYSAIGSETTATTIFRQLEAMTYIDISVSTELFLDTYSTIGSSDTVLKVFEYIDKGLTYKSEGQFAAQLKLVNKMYSTFGSTSRSVSMLALARELVSQGKADSLEGVVKNILATYSSIGDGDTTEKFIREAAKMNATAAGTNSSIEVGLSLYSSIGSVSTSLEMMKLIRKAYTSQLISGYKVGAAQLMDIYTRNGSSSTTIDVYSKMIVAAKSSSELQDMVLTFGSVYSSIGSTSSSLVVLDLSRSLYVKRLTTSIKAASDAFLNVYSNNGTSEGSRELIGFLAERCVDAYEFDGGIKMYLQALRTHGSHSSAMQALKNLW